MKIGVDARSLLCSEPRGEGKSLLRLYSEILKLDSRVQVVMFGDRHHSAFRGELPEGLRVVVPTVMQEHAGAWENIALPWLATMEQTDVLHCASSGAPWLSAVPLVMTVHDLIPVMFEDGHGERLRRQFKRRLKNGLRRARRVITVSAHTRTDLLKWAPDLRVPVDVIPWGADDRRDAVSPRPPMAPVEPYFMAFGGEARRKNTEFTLDCFAAVASRVPGLRLVMAGVNSTWQKERVHALLSELGISDRVSLPGFVHERELDGLVRNAVAVIYPSLYEGFGLPLLEAIGAGTPVVASDRTSIPEVLAGAPGALPLERDTFADVLAMLATNPARRHQWVTQQSEVLHRYRWPETARRTLDCFRAAVGGAT